MRHEKKRKRGGSSHDLEVTVPVTKWAKRNMEWWLRCFDDADGCPRFRCVQERITYRDAIEADACMEGFGGFIVVGATMYYFLGKWDEFELASFDSTEPKTLCINAFEMVTQKFMVYLGTSPTFPVQPPPLVGESILPKCDNGAAVTLKESYRARNEHLAQLLEDYDFITAKHAVRVFMVHIPGVLNKVSDILSREGVCPAFHDAVRNDFPCVKTRQDISNLLPEDVRSLSNVL